MGGNPSAGCGDYIVGPHQVGPPDLLGTYGLDGVVWLG
jgi:hypothetical protein